MSQPASILLHPLTVEEIMRLLTTPPHAIILEAPKGSGKQTVSHWLAEEIAGVTDVEKALQQVLLIDKGDEKSLKIDKVRKVEQFLMRKLPGNGMRIVIIEDAETMSADAQNALLKTLEEPPADAVILLVTDAATSLLATVRSRAVKISLRRPPAKDVRSFFADQGYDAKDVERAMLMSGALPGLMQAILSSDASHPMLSAADQARRIIQATRFGRLTTVDGLAKQREQSIALCHMLQQMADVGLQADPLSAQWQRILRAAYTAEEQLHGNALPKLVLTNLMLNL